MPQSTLAQMLHQVNNNKFWRGLKIVRLIISNYTLINAEDEIENLKLENKNIRKQVEEAYKQLENNNGYEISSEVYTINDSSMEVDMLKKKLQLMTDELEFNTFRSQLKN